MKKTESVVGARNDADALHAELRDLIAGSRARLASTVNSELTRLYWAVGKREANVAGGTRDHDGTRSRMLRMYRNWCETLVIGVLMGEAGG